MVGPICCRAIFYCMFVRPRMSAGMEVDQEVEFLIEMAVSCITEEEEMSVSSLQEESGAYEMATVMSTITEDDDASVYSAEEEEEVLLAMAIAQFVGYAIGEAVPVWREAAAVDEAVDYRNDMPLEMRSA